MSFAEIQENWCDPRIVSLFLGMEIFQRRLALSMTAASLTLEPFSWAVAVYSNVDAALPWLARLDA